MANASTQDGHRAAIASALAASNDRKQSEPINRSNVIDVMRQMRTLSLALDRGTYQLVSLLPDFDRQQGWSRDGHRSCLEWLGAECGMSRSAASDRRRVGYALEKLPILSALFERGDLSWSKIRSLTRIATLENEQALAGDALYMTANEIEQLVRQYRNVTTADELADEDSIAEDQSQKRSVTCGYDPAGMVRINALLPPLEGTAIMRALERAEDVLFTACDVTRTARQLRADALEMMAARYLASEELDGRQADQYQVIVHVDAATLVQTVDNPNPLPTLSPPRCHIDNGPSIAASTMRRILDQSGIMPLLMKNGEPISIGRKSRVWTAPMSRAIVARDCHCQFPGCSARRHLHIHHIKYWADGGETSIDNGVTLCGFHHRLVHERQYVVERIPLDANGQLPQRTHYIKTGDAVFAQLVSDERRFRISAR